MVKNSNLPIRLTQLQLIGFVVEIVAYFSLLLMVSVEKDKNQNIKCCVLR